jgi:hypothetical protein
VGDRETERSFAFRARPYGIKTPFALFTEVARYHLYDVVERITTPMLVTDPEDDQFFPGQPQRLSTPCPGRRRWPHSPVNRAPTTIVSRSPVASSRCG